VPLHPPPLIEEGALFVTQKFLRSDMSRAAEIVFALQCADATLATYQDAVDDFQANFNANIGSDMDAEVSILPPTGLGGDGSNVPLLVTAAGAAIAGGSAITTLPPNCAMLVKKTTSLGGRHNRGRCYIPFILSEGNVSENGTLSGALITGIQPSLDTFLAQLGTDSTGMHIENRVFDTSGPKPFVTERNISVAAVTGFKVETLIATQRRRLGR
jgi:hypothetical protein